MIYLNQKGISLVSVLMAAGLVGGLALTIAKIGFNSSKIQSNATTSNEINELYNRVQKHMLSSDNCRATIANAEVSTGDKLKDTSLVIDDEVFLTKLYKMNEDGRNLNYADALPFIESQKKVNLSSKLTIDKIIFKRTGLKTVELTLSIDRDPSPSKKNIINKKFELSMSFDTIAGNKPLSCFSQMDNAIVSAVEQSCISLGGTLNGDLCSVNIQQLANRVSQLESSISELESRLDSVPKLYRCPNTPCLRDGCSGQIGTATTCQKKSGGGNGCNRSSTVACTLL